MKIALASDLHLEFGNIDLKNSENANVLILGGDICIASDLSNSTSKNRNKRYIDFFKYCSVEFPHVVYVMGNHEHYHGDFATSANKFRSLFETHELSNIYLLDKEVKVIDDVTFIGGTLWTDMNKEDPITMVSVRSIMNDFRCINNSNKEVTYRNPVPILDENGEIRKDDNGLPMNKIKFEKRTPRFSPEDAVNDHREMIDFIRMVVRENDDKKFVVVGHHAPSKLSTHPRYANEMDINGAYSSDLSEFILDYPQIKLWTHGHTHDSFDYVIGSTRVVCNPRGYVNYEDRAIDFKLQYIEI